MGTAVLIRPIRAVSLKITYPVLWNGTNAVSTLEHLTAKFIRSVGAVLETIADQ